MSLCVLSEDTVHTTAVKFIVIMSASINELYHTIALLHRLHEVQWSESFLATKYILIGYAPSNTFQLLVTA